MIKTLEEKPLNSENIRIGVFQQGEFIQYLDVSREFSDVEITELCVEVFSEPVDWEHFSCAERFTGAVNRMPPATGDGVMTMWY